MQPQVLRTDCNRRHIQSPRYKLLLSKKRGREKKKGRRRGIKLGKRDESIKPHQREFVFYDKRKKRREKRGKTNHGSRPAARNSA